MAGLGLTIHRLGRVLVTNALRVVVPILLFATVFPSHVYGQGWVPQTSGTTNSLRGVHFAVDGTTGYAVGDVATLLKTTDGGANWFAQTPGTANPLRDVHFPVDAITGYAVGGSGTILKTTNGGANWVGQTSGTANNLHDVHFPVDAITGYALGNSGTILKTTDGGANWVGQTSSTTNILRDVHFPVGATTGYVVGNSGTILKTTDGGANWIAQTSGTANDLLDVDFPVDATTGYAVGLSGTILKTTDGGANWVPQTSGTANGLNGVSFPVSASSGYVVGGSGIILKTTDGGANWVAQTSGTPNSLFAVHFPVDSNTGYAVGGTGTILKTTVGGAAGAGFSSDPFGYAVGSLAGNNGGSGWLDAWGVEGSGSIDVVGTSLAHPGGGLVTSGVAVQLNSGAVVPTQAARNLSSTWGTTNETLWASFLVTPQHTGAASYLGITLGTAGTPALPDPARLFVGYYGPNFNLNNWGHITDNVDVPGAVVGQTAFVVLRLDISASGNETATMYINPTPGLAAPDVAASAGKSDLDLGSFSTVTVGGGRGFTANPSQLDEIRIGSSYAEVAPGFGSNLSGTVFEDLNYGGGAGRTFAGSGGSVRSGAKVELYSAAGAFVDSISTNGSGQYTFSWLANGSYQIRVVSSTVTSSRSGYVAGLLPVQTYRTDASSGTAADMTDRVGGEVPQEVDPAINTTDATLASLNAGAGEEVQSLAPVTVSGADISGVDFGFNFSTIVNTNDAGQGSLRQFIDNATMLGAEGSLAQSGDRKDVDGVTQSLPAGYESSIFMISDGNAHPGLRVGLANLLTAGVAVITPTVALPGLTGANTVVDGTTQTVNVGNTNPAVLGTGGTVGVNGLSLRTVAGPEVEILGTGTVANGLSIQANDAIVRGLSIHGFGSASGDAGVRVEAVTSALIEGNVLGSAATAFTDPGAPQRNQAGVHSVGGNSGIVRDNLIGFGRRTGVFLGSGSTGWAISGNEIRDSGMETADGDGITVNASSSNTASGNLITGSSSQGVAVTGAGTVDNTFVNNTITGNGVGTASSVVQSAGVTIRSGPTSTTLDRNVIRTNYGAGVAVNNGATGTRMTQNSFELNGTITARNGGGVTGQIGIDLNSPTDDNDFGTSPFYTPNDVGDLDSGGNNLFNFPFIEGVGLDLATDSLEITGFARPGSVIEFFVAAVDPSGFGEAQTYLTTLVEGGAGDLDSGTGSYTHAQAGSDDTNRFRFKIDNPGGIAVGTELTATATDGANNTSEFSRNVQVVAARDLLFSSAANQTFWVGKAPTAISPITVGEGSPTAITDADDIRIRIPAGFDMLWDTLDLAATLTGPASGKVSPTVGYEDAGATLVLDVTSDFVFGDTVVISGLSFMDFTGGSGADNLELEVNNDDAVSATDDQTVEILAPGTPVFFSQDDQSFRVGDPPTPISLITVRADADAPTITAANDIRIHIPFGFNMRWDTDNSALILGTASGKVSSTVSYEDGGMILVVDVLTDFDPNDFITIEELSFRNFNAPSIEDNLELEVFNDGATSAIDPQIIFVVDLDAPTLSSSKNQGFNVGDPPTPASSMRVTANDFISQITAANDIRIRIPAGFQMVWDISQTGKLTGQGKNKVSPTVTYEDGGRTAVIDVLEDFAPKEFILISDLLFTTFLSAHPPDQLEMLAYNDGSVSDVDDMTKTIFGSIWRVDVWPTSTTTDRLPSNGTNYTTQFTVSNTGNVAEDFDLLTSTSPGGTISVVSMTGLDVTQGANPDSARITNLPASDSRVVIVTYSVAQAPMATIDTLLFLARPVSNPTQTDEGRLVLTVIRPQITLGKIVNPNGTQPPGTDLTYTVTVTNTGNDDAADLVSVDSLAAEIEFQVGSMNNSLPAGVAVVVEYSDDGGSTWTYTPTSGACAAPAGYDRCVDRIRWTFQNPLSSTAPNNAASFEYIARIR